MKEQSLTEKKGERIYRIVNFKKKSKAFKVKGYLEGIILTNRESRDCIKVSNWNGHNKSFHILLKTFGSRIIVDSGVIEQLATEIKYLKRNMKKIKSKNIFDKLIVINFREEYY